MPISATAVLWHVAVRNNFRVLARDDRATRGWVRALLCSVRMYERLALLVSILRNVYIDDERVTKEYLKRCKEGAWKEENTKDAAKCWNIERVIGAELLG